MANRLGGQEWLYLEAAHDADPSLDIDPTGYPIETDGSNLGRYAALRYRLSELAETARQQIEELPDPRLRPEVPRAADLFMHLRYRCGFLAPTVYDSSEFVIEFGEVCKAANVHLSPQRLKNILSEVVRTFDRFISPPGLDQILVLKPQGSASSV